MYDILELNSKVLSELRGIAQSMGIERVEIMKKPDLIFRILDLQPALFFTSSSKKKMIRQPAIKADACGKNTLFFAFYRYFRKFFLWFFIFRRNEFSGNFGMMGWLLLLHYHPYFLRSHGLLQMYAMIANYLLLNG